MKPGRQGLFEGNKRKAYTESPLGPGGSNREAYSSGRRDRSTEALTNTKRGDFTPTVRAPKSPAPTGGERPLAKRAGAVHSGYTYPGKEQARLGKIHDPKGSTLSHDLHMNAAKNTGKHTAVYSTPKPKTMK